MDFNSAIGGKIDSQTIKSFDNEPAIGPADAKVRIIDYSDYYCPSCIPIYEKSLQPVLKEFAGQVRFVSRQVIAIAAESYIANHAAYCAHEQGKYWEMHEKIMFRVRPFIKMKMTMENIDKFQDLVFAGTPDYFIELAQTIEGIDIEKFAASMKSDRYKQRIHAVNDAFKSLNIKGVPVTFVGNYYFMGYVPLDELRSVICSQLSR